MAYDDEAKQIGDYVFERHEGVIMCFPFFNEEDGSVDTSKQLNYGPCDMLYDLDECFKLFREQYREYCPDDIMGFSIKLTVSEWFEFFNLALHESIKFISVDRFHAEDKKYSWRAIKNMITPISQNTFDILSTVEMVCDDDFNNYSIGVIENNEEIIITSVIELSLEELQSIDEELSDYSFIKMDNSNFIKYYVFKWVANYD